MTQGFVYILTNKNNGVLYTGATNDLIRRVYEHKHKLTKGFASRYNVDKLVYYEVWEDTFEAYSREKQIKNLLRNKKIKLIDNFNPQWRDLYDTL